MLHFHIFVAKSLLMHKPFDYQHAGSDTFDKINSRKMQLGSPAIATLVYLID